MINDLGLGIVVTMRDLFSRNAANIESAMASLDAKVAASSERMTRNLDRIQKGTMMMGAGLALMAAPAALVASTAATQKALGEMASLGTKDLRALEDAAESFTNQWAGASKAEFIGAAYDVKSALANLSDEAVGTFSAMAALTAKATKATTQEMVGTFTTGYGIFKTIMPEYSDMDWAKAFSGAMAQTVAAFKTTGPQMADAIKNVGATAAASNIPLQEQLGILGQLQTTMPGSEAGTLYKAFIMKAAEAGKELGLSLVDSQGRLKGVLPVLREIQNRFPDLSQAAAQVQIKKAFGSDEAVKFVLQMSAGMESLQQNIESIEQAMKGGITTTEAMARAMNQDIGAQFTLAKQQISNLFEIMGRTLLPVITPVMHGVSHIVRFLQRMAKAAPGVTGAVLGLALALGAVLVVAGAVVAAIGAIGVLVPAVSAGIAAIGPVLAGAGAAIATYFWPVTLAIGALIAIVYALRRAWTSDFAGIRTLVMGVWNKVWLALDGVRALMISLKDGTGEISEELARRLQAAGLMTFVSGLFRVYYRLRECYAGLSQALAHGFARARAILEPAVRALLDAYAALGSAVFSLLEAFGLVSTAADASSFRTLGRALGTLIGIIIQVDAFILRGLIAPFVAVIRLIALVVRAVAWLAKVTISAFIESARFAQKYLLPIRLFIEELRLAAHVAYSLWQMLSGDVSFTEGLKEIGRAVFRFLTTPFRWARDVAQGIWGAITGLFSALGGLVTNLASAMVAAILSLPLVNALANVFQGIRSFLSGDLGFFDAGKAMLTAFAEGIWSAATLPFRMLKRALGFLRRLLPFSDAQEGPLSDLTLAGAAFLRTFAQGMLSAVALPGRILRQSLGTAMQGAATPFRWAAGLAHRAWDGLRSMVTTRFDSPELPTVPAPAIQSLDRHTVVRQPAQRENPLRFLLNAARAAALAGFVAVHPVAAAQPPAFPVAGPAVRVEVPAVVPPQVVTISQRPVQPFVPASTFVALRAPAPSAPLARQPFVPMPADIPVRHMATPPLRESVVAPRVAEGPVRLDGTAIITPRLAGVLPRLETTARVSPVVSPALPSMEAAASFVPAISEVPATTPFESSPRSAPAPVEPTTQRQQQLLGETRGAGATQQPTDDSFELRAIRLILERLLAKLDELGQRPVDLSVALRLDGRQIAQAVYKDLREQKVKNYETL